MWDHMIEVSVRTTAQGAADFALDNIPFAAVVSPESVAEKFDDDIAALQRNKRDMRRAYKKIIKPKDKATGDEEGLEDE
ncbi:MAG: hypothetical protein Q4E57_05785 [Eubacteriales bacterium]|nr:hypothetical protein [Eubacteriales bacterium]